jgi:hypothetical protein
MAKTCTSLNLILIIFCKLMSNYIHSCIKDGSKYVKVMVMFLPPPTFQNSDIKRLFTTGSTHSK